MRNLSPVFGHFFGGWVQCKIYAEPITLCCFVRQINPGRLRRASLLVLQEKRETDKGEPGFCAAIAGEHGVPVLLVAGDDKVCAEARELLGRIETAQVKTGLGRHRGLCLSPEESAKVLKQAARNALGLKDQIKPFILSSPIEIRLTYKHTHLADAAHIDNPKAELVDGYTLAFQVEKISDWFGRWGKRF